MSTTSSVSIGRKWFEWRGVSPLPWILLALILPIDTSHTSLSFSWILIGILFCEALRVWAVGYAGSRTRTRGATVEQLVHQGPYRFVRNPLYIANIGMYGLACLLIGQAKLVPWVLAYSILQYVFIVQFEEDALRKTFSARYEEYCQKVPRWLPSLNPSIEASPHEFSLAQALRSERSTLIAIGVLALFAISKQFLL